MISSLRKTEKEKERNLKKTPIRQKTMTIANSDLSIVT